MAQTNKSRCGRPLLQLVTELIRIIVSSAVDVSTRAASYFWNDVHEKLLLSSQLRVLCP